MVNRSNNLEIISIKLTKNEALHIIGWAEELRDDSDVSLSILDKITESADKVGKQLVKGRR